MYCSKKYFSLHNIIFRLSCVGSPQCIAITFSATFVEQHWYIYIIPFIWVIHSSEISIWIYQAPKCYITEYFDFHIYNRSIFTSHILLPCLNALTRPVH